MKNKKQNILTNPREAAYIALLAALREEAFISDSLEFWRKTTLPTTQNFHFAQEIAFGSSKMALALDYIAEQLAERQKLTMKLKERALLRTAIYQYSFMDRVPTYAIVDETIKIAKKHCHDTFVKFLNALLRKLPEDKATAPPLPSGDSVYSLSTRYSYPPFYIEALKKSYDLTQIKTFLVLGNTPSKTMARLRTSNPLQMITLEDSSELQEIATSKDHYIQNITPATLMGSLYRKDFQPKRILDLCAAPGGKTLLAHDLYSEAVLYANDISPEKLRKLTENFSKYEIAVSLSCSRGETFSSDELFDLILLDVPCSNSGVFNKRQEARWRLSQDSVNELEVLQLALIQNAQKLLAPHGEIWYMTCSILSSENRLLVDKACELFGLSLQKEKLVLPEIAGSGHDGGYGCALKKV